MKIELKTKSLSEIVKKCENLGWDIKDVKICSKIFEDISRLDDQMITMLNYTYKIQRSEND